ncbi:MAG: hypothetical protein R6W75_08295 [Smithellaceae bacterium]
MKKSALSFLKVIVVSGVMVFSMGQSATAAAVDAYHIDLQYSADQAVIPEHLKAGEKARGVLISVAEFLDARRIDDKKVIGHVRERDDSRVPIFSKSVTHTRTVAGAIGKYLKKAGYSVSDQVSPWDLQEATLPKHTGKVVVGGRIDALDVTCWTGAFSNDYKVDMKLTLVVADAARGKIIYQGSVTVGYSRTDVSFSEEQIGREAGIALADAVEKIFEGKNPAQKIKEAITQ